ncbi:hypothetical protein BC936DRAFT_146059 [Jimgerdemannia flammicorona]|uniref:DNA replication complex GINS protein PSF3 n=1 Tax=Jimgerdemannia flammicorona TaxID=994334 RepID=A0A433D8G6_9FUNG|nr:hypothetical protein BC936DRAFT_146059 [Jimgerdemannia flammicorona]
MGDDYYNIDAILADQQKLPCIFKCDVKGLGYLDGNNDVDLRRDTKVELPFWLVETLAKAPDLFEVAGLPKYYGTRVRSALNASPTSIDFRSLCPYYYMFGVRLVTLLKDDPLTEMLGKAFKARLQLIMDYAQNGSSQEQTEFLQMLDETEREHAIH